jgi:hypothetical protein
MFNDKCVLDPDPHQHLVTPWIWILGPNFYWDPDGLERAKRKEKCSKKIDAGN